MSFLCAENQACIVVLPDEYLALLKARKYKPRSIRTYRNTLNLCLVFLARRGLTRLQDATRRDLEEYRLDLVKRGLSGASIYDYLRHVKRFFAYMEENQLLFNNPARDLVLPEREHKLQPIPTEAEVAKLLKQPDTAATLGLRDRALLEVAYSTGLRLEELSRLNVGDPDLKEGRVRVLGKGSKERVTPLGGKAVCWLEKYIRHGRTKLLGANPDEPALWLGEQGRRLNPLLIERLVRSYAILAGIRTHVTPHALRRACATHMLRGGAHPVQIQMLLGHSSLETLSQYLRVTIRDLKQMHQRSKPGL